MKKTVRAHQEPLSEPLARSLLAMPGKDGTPLYGKLQAALTALKEAVSEANDQLRDNPLTPIVAREAARQLGRRGDAAIRVDPSGVVFLEVGQASADAPAEDKREWTTKYPSLQTLRAAAAKLGIDTAPMGRSKRQIVDAIRKAKTKTVARPAPPPPPEPTPPPPEAPKMVRTAPAISPPVVVQMTDQGQVVPSPPPPSPPPQSPAPPAKKIGGRTLSQIAAAAEDEVDLDAIFAKPAPPQPPSD